MCCILPIVSSLTLYIVPDQTNETVSLGKESSARLLMDHKLITQLYHYIEQWTIVTRTIFHLSTRSELVMYNS